MSKKYLDDSLPFYKKTKLLDQITQKSPDNLDPKILKEILELLQSNSDLGAYFYRSNPHFDWVNILWEHGFLKKPPVSSTQEQYLPRWDAQNFLISVADKAPGIVVKHLNQIEGNDWYVVQALRALTYVPLDKAAEVLPKILEILNKPSVDRSILERCYELMISFAENGFEEAAFQLFESMTEPMPPSPPKEESFFYRNAAVAKNEDVFARYRQENQIQIFSTIDVERLIVILDSHLRKALILEETDSSDPIYKRGSSWRNAIEFSDQNFQIDYKETLLENLREVIHHQLELQNNAVEERIRHYLNDEFHIFKRLGIHFTRVFKLIFSQEANILLTNFSNLDDFYIHHEIFLLLREGFGILSEEKQKKLLSFIMTGPPEETKKKFPDWWKSSSASETIELAEYIKSQIDHWQFRRLWMIQEQLTGQAKQRFEELHVELGDPSIPPEFHSYSTGVQQVVYESPVPKDELKLLPPQELLDFLINWKPESNRTFWPSEQTHASLGREVASLIFEDFLKYEEILLKLALAHSDYGYAIIDEFSKLEQPTLKLWKLITSLCIDLLGFQGVREEGTVRDNSGWYSARMSMARLLQDAYSKKEKTPPNEILPEIKKILLILIDDSDPDLERDQPPEENSRFGDPTQVALNSIRPIVLNTLVSLAMEEYKLTNENYSHELGPKRMGKDIQEALERKLDPHLEPSRAVRSVFGERLINLFWLDNEWMIDHLDNIFPVEQDEDNRWLFVSAMSSYTIFGYFYGSVYPLLRKKYELAIDYFSSGYVWDSHLQPVANLAGHLIWPYLESDYSLDVLDPDGNNLFIRFFNKMDADGRKDGAFICRRVLDNPENIEKYWDKIRNIWTWRIQVANNDSNSSDYDNEILEFLYLLEKAPDSENLETMYGLLRESIKHLGSIEYRDHFWDEIEKYLASQVNQYPEIVIELYTAMFKKGMPSRWVFDSERARKIIEETAKNPKSNQQAGDLINYIGSKLQDDRFRDIYEEYC